MFFESFEDSEADYYQLKARFPVTHVSDHVVYYYVVQPGYRVSNTKSLSFRPTEGKPTYF